MFGILSAPINEEHYFLEGHPFLTIILAIFIFAIFIGIVLLTLWLIAKITDKIKEKKANKKELNELDEIQNEKLYCKNCGAEIFDDSTYCRYCGCQTKQSSALQQKNTVEKPDHHEMDDPSRDKKIIVGIFIVIIVFTLIIAGICVKAYNDSTSAQKKATNYDVIIQTSTSLFSYNITLTPKKNIDNLEITFEFYGDNNQKIATKTKVVGNVKKNTRYDISFSISEFSLASLTSISKFKWNVTGGTVNTE